MDSKLRFFKHYKNKPYKYLGTVRHSETLEEMALYETLYENELGKLWVRPHDMFFENVVIDGKTRPRFEKIEFKFKQDPQFDSNEYENFKTLYREVFGEDLNEFKFKSKLNAHHDFLFLTAYDQQKLVAFKFGYSQDGQLFYSWLGGVHPQYQKLGLGSELLKLQFAWCKDRNISRIETKTMNQYSDMIRLNLKAGFKIIGTLTESNRAIKIIFEKNLI